ncbi:MAG: triosephosphate isomerase (TIM) [Parcubacteria group bacterium Gr01-1014_49]|nr:MAG: triosephosphate isomerase (TIM) [Parcubacteria group bacterium Gr01-1014_49]
MTIFAILYSMLIVANWKAYIEDFKRAKKLFALSKRLVRATGIRIVLAPPSPFLGALAANNKSRVAFSAQDISVTTGGAQTGEATAAAYAAAGAAYAIIGHSERRALGETREVIAQKLAHAFAHGLTPILCVGEHERDGGGRYLAFIREELASALTPLPSKERAKIIVAYEPLWAIGKTAADAIKPNDLVEMVLYIRKVLAELLPGKGSQHIPVLYGGSVEPENARLLALDSGIDGFLVGHASVDPDSLQLLAKHLA